MNKSFPGEPLRIPSFVNSQPTVPTAYERYGPAFRCGMI